MIFHPDIFRRLRSSDEIADGFPNARESAQSNPLLNNIVEEVKHSQLGGNFPIDQSTSLEAAKKFLFQKLPAVIKEPYKDITVDLISQNGNNPRISVQII